jgi:DNA-binding response OmpR family regulator
MRSTFGHSNVSATERIPATPVEKVQRGLLIDRHLFVVMFGGKEIELTATEFDLLHALYEERHRVVPRPELHSKVWAEGSPGPRVVDTYVSRLRAKLRAAGHPGIASVRKRGYRLLEPAA